MLNLDIAVSSFWQLARHWKSGESAKLELECEGGNLNIQLSARLGHPDSVLSPAPSPASTQSSCKGKSHPSYVVKSVDKKKLSMKLKKLTLWKKTCLTNLKKVLILLQKRLSQYLKNSWSKSLLKSKQNSLCNLNVNIVTTESAVKLS